MELKKANAAHLENCKKNYKDQTCATCQYIRAHECDDEDDAPTGADKTTTCPECLEDYIPKDFNDACPECVESEDEHKDEYMTRCRECGNNNFHYYAETSIDCFVDKNGELVRDSKAEDGDANESIRCKRCGEVYTHSDFKTCNI